MSGERMLFVMIWIFGLMMGSEGLRVAIVGEGVIGTSTAMALKTLDPDVEITVYHDKNFKDILSFGIAGLFRIDDGTPINKIYGRDTFDRLAKLWREEGGVSGVQLVSGHILSTNKTKLDIQWDNYGEVVYNYHNLTQREMISQFAIQDLDKYSAIHYTAYTSEGARYVPWMKQRLIHDHNTMYIKKQITDLDELGKEFDVVINCAGLAGGVIAGDGDDKNVYPIRGVLIKTKASWQKHFLYKDFATFTIPVIDSVYVGTVKAEHNDSLILDKTSIDQIWEKYIEIQPAFKDVKPVDYFVGLRPARVGGVRVELQNRNTTDGKEYKVVHNYGHGGNGFTLGWGSALHAAKLALGQDVSGYEAAKGKA